LTHHEDADLPVYNEGGVWLRLLAFGHISIRHPANPNRYLISRAIAPALMTIDDIMEFDLDSNPVDQRGRGMFIERALGLLFK
jgi:hypothetical protein